MENNSIGITTIGQARIKTYETLSRYPLYDYFCDTGKGKECNVLLIGNGWVGTEFFKAIFWCGVYPGVKLNITIASSNAARYQKKLEKAFPKDLWIDMHHRTIAFGRAICHAKSPDCLSCKLQQYCSYFKKSSSTKGR